MNISLDAQTKETFRRISRRNGVDRVLLLNLLFWPLILPEIDLGSRSVFLNRHRSATIMARKPELITEHKIWRAIVSALKESSLVGVRLKNGCGCQGDETIMIRANGSDIFWIHVSQLDEEFAEDAIAEWDETPEL